MTHPQMIFLFFCAPYFFFFFYCQKSSPIFFFFFSCCPWASVCFWRALFFPRPSQRISAPARRSHRAGPVAVVSPKGQKAKKRAPFPAAIFIISFTSYCLGCPKGSRLFSFRVFFLGTAGAHESRCPSSFEKKKKKGHARHKGHPPDNRSRALARWRANRWSKFFI
ncbi:hypothetical protein [Pandoravirus japonicus]|uniref:Uncharacterized protein n=1 Tax=Pandoravirus japonicus TaxID=2823154 RepID=A0A811BQS1_9VIRU|nr:hypothetical protein [Pandoravirus japonicus]